jgi:uncharacterized protein (DUF362 family)
MRAQVAIGRATGYDPLHLRAQLEQLISDLGGLSDLIRPGARVGIKANLTGGTWWDGPNKPPATEFFVTHPAVIGALAGLLKDAGARSITVMDGLGDPTSFEQWGYVDMAAPLGLNLTDLNLPAPHPGFTRLAVNGTPLVYDTFWVNAILTEIDVFISVAKMKCHTTTGVTLAMKNLFGLAPTSEYRRRAEDNNRSAFHESTKFDTRVPKVILDLNRARPIDLAIIDGIFTAEAGAGPWDAGMSQIKPGLLVAGRNPVAVDAVATSLMGFDPTVPAGTLPFIGSDNHIALANQMGLGPHRLKEIQVKGADIQTIRVAFKPARVQ